MLVTAGGLTAQTEPAPNPAEEISPEMIEARRESVSNLETHIAQREERLAEWGRDIVDLDTRIEHRVDELVKLLAGLRDSQQSRTNVTQMKREAIDGLRNGIEIYSRKRREVAESIRQGDESALGDLGKFDERIIKRVDQIAELTKSIPTHQDTDRYESDGGSYWNGYYYENSRVSDEWRQNRRDRTASDQQRRETSRALQSGLDRLDQRRRALKDSLENRNLTASERKLYATELGQIDAYTDHLKAQLADVTTATSGGGTPIGRGQAHDIGNLIEDARRDLREDVARLFRTYDQFARGRAYLAGLKEKLDARRKWLEENAPQAD